MTRRVTVSVPDDVAAALDALPARQVSAYVTDAIRLRHTADQVRDALRNAGHPDYPVDPEGARARLAAGCVPADLAARVAQEWATELDRPVPVVDARDTAA
jgi:hypothetical protein